MEYEYIKILPNGWVRCDTEHYGSATFNPMDVKAWHYSPWNGSSGGFARVILSGGKLIFHDEAGKEVDHFLSEHIKNHEN